MAKVPIARCSVVFGREGVIIWRAIGELRRPPTETSDCKLSADDPLNTDSDFEVHRILEGVVADCPAKVLISFPMPCATLNDSSTTAMSSSPSPQVAVIMER